MLKISDMVNYLRTLKRIVIIGEEDSEFVKAARHMLLESEEHIMKHHGVGLNKYLEGERNFMRHFPIWIMLNEKTPCAVLKNVRKWSPGMHSRGGI